MPRMTVDLLCKCTGHAKRRRGESAEQFLQRITHLYCAEKGIETIEALGHCRNLSVLYLYDNFLSRLEGLGTCPALTHLYLHDNHLSKIEGLGGLHRLTKLYLSGNAITVVEGLEGLGSLAELHIAHQRLPEGEKLLFDPRSLQAIAPTLNVLNVSGNSLDSLEDLCCLWELTQLSASDNQLSDMKELGRVLAGWPNLVQLDVMGNPFCQKYKYRDRIVTLCKRIGEVDGHVVSETERQFLLSWKAMRRARRRQHRQARAGRIPDGVPTAQQILSSLPAPLTMPALPARQPLRDWKKKQQQPQQGALEYVDTAGYTRLPQIVQNPHMQLEPLLATARNPHHLQLDPQPLQEIVLNPHVPLEPQVLQRLPLESLSPIKDTTRSSWRAVATVGSDAST